MENVARLTLGIIIFLIQGAIFYKICEYIGGKLKFAENFLRLINWIKKGINRIRKVKDE